VLRKTAFFLDNIYNINIIKIMENNMAEKESSLAADLNRDYISKLEYAAYKDINSSRAHFALAEAYYNESFPDLALREYRIVKTLEPEHAGAYIGIARVLDKMGDRPGAVRTLEKSFTFSPDNREVLTGLFKYYRSSREYIRALDMLYRLKDVYPEDLRLYVEIEKLEKRAGILKNT
jgi:tetratricopeptide (TPR) repeat protein